MVAAVVVPPAYAGDADREADADPRAEASKRFRRGVKLYNDGDFVAALIEFKRAYELEPNYRVLYNLGQTSRELKDYAAALRAYEQCWPVHFRGTRHVVCCPSCVQQFNRAPGQFVEQP